MSDVDIEYTDAQRLAIALAELASALGVRLTRNDAINPDWRLVDRLTAHVRGLSERERESVRRVAPLPIALPAMLDACGGSPGTPAGDMALLGVALQSRQPCVDEVRAFNRTLERVRNMGVAGHYAPQPVGARRVVISPSSQATYVMTSAATVEHDALEARVTALERDTHAPCDFSALVARLEALEARLT
jgi:hypothetical protein